MGKRILVIDDDPSVLVIFEKVLGRDGHRVHTCGSAPRALTELARAKFDLVVVDKTLPGMSGFDLLGLLRQTEPHLPAIMMTSYPEPLLAPAARLQGYLAKPFESLKLISDTVRRVLELSELRRAVREELDRPSLLLEPAHSRGSR